MIRTLLVATMTSPLWAGFAAIAWQAGKLARTVARTLAVNPPPDSGRRE